MFDFIVSSPHACHDVSLAIAASRAGALGVADLQFSPDNETACARVGTLAANARGRWGAHVDEEELLAAALAGGADGLDTIVVSAPDAEQLSALIGRARAAGARAVAVATCLEHGLAAEAAGADAVIAKGHEAGGWIGEESAFVLLQRLVAALRTPVWVHGGVGVHTVAAAYVGGAAGAVLDSQLLLTREAQVSAEIRDAIGAMDGSETAALGSELRAPLRVYSRPGLGRVGELANDAARLARTGDREGWRQAVKLSVGDGSPGGGLLLVGQDAEFAADLAARFTTVAGVLDGLRRGIDDAVGALARENPLSEGSPLARAHGTRYPIVQGPMTRVSDRAEFATAVAKAGALPFLALALMRSGEADLLLESTRQMIGGHPWGVGILGFVPPELRAEQLAVVRAHRPPFALIAGGRPDQARALEDDGIATYLHVPSPGLLKLYLNDGARRFVFEGRECGGHVGPRTSFVLWEAMLRVLLEDQRVARECQILLAGGIHDARSAAMAAAAAATASERHVQAGVLLGTAYLFTREATEQGAITSTFQDAAVSCSETVLLESGPGHATRCLPSPFVEQFAAEKDRLRGAGIASDETRARLEELNVGRLRIAAKGTDRNPLFGSVADVPKLAAVEPSHQWERGMYMIGQVASLHGDVTNLAHLHRDVSDGSDELIEAMPARGGAEPASPPPADIAIVGLGCILPGAPDVETFWANILGKVDAIREVPEERWDVTRMYDPDPLARDKVYSRWGGFIDPVPFDPIAIGMPPKSLASIEPFQLLALITAQAALRDAGYASRPFDRDRTSVILGAGGGGADLSVGYTVRSALPGLLRDAAPDLEDQLYDRLPEWTEDSFAGLLMNVAAGRIANRLDFGGTNYTVDAACASSLAAIGLGARELQFGSSHMVLAGGIDAIQNPFAYLCFAKTRALSPRGRCRPFDASADGIAISEGFATVVLKRLADAERDGDRIYAVIRGVGAASDGRDRSLTAPRPEGQMRALRRAYAQARCSPATVGLVEAHGTGTVAGDGAEIQALSTVFAEHGTNPQWCAVGSVKSMIGHTKATAGVAGLIRAALALHHCVLPPTIGVSEPNPKADFPQSPFYVNSEARPWLSGGADHPRRAGVSAFGFGGTDFHIVLEEYTGDYLKGRKSTVERWPGELLLWRGSRTEIAAGIESLARALDAGAEPRLADLALTLALDAADPQPGDAALALVPESIDDLREKLERARSLLEGTDVRLHSPNGIHFAQQPLARAGGRVAFLFPGQGSQTVDMARDLTIAFPEAREPFELADRVLAEDFAQPLSRYIFPPPAFSDEVATRYQQELTDTHVAQPALGVAELAYRRVLSTFGVTPDLTAGHSYGEFVALATAGVLDDEQLLRLSEARGRLMAEAAAGAAGAMAAVDAAVETLEPLLADGGVVAANLNGPLQTVISGPRERIDKAVNWCRERGIRARALPVACAFHSPHVAGAQERLAEELAREEMSAPEIPVYSNTTGHVHEEAQIASVLAEHLAKPVQFVSEIEAMYEDGARLFVEVGPRSVLTGLTGQIVGDREHVAVPIDRPGRSGLVSLLQCLATLAAEGVPVQYEQILRDRGAERCDLKRLATEGRPGARAGMWLVDGGHARPADESRKADPNPIIPPKEQPTVTSTSTNGAGTLMPIAKPEHPVPVTNGPDVHAPPPAAVEPTASAPGGDHVAAVMLRYQQVMQQFLETERAVMLGYLGAARPGTGQRPPAPAAPAPSPLLRASELPAPAAIAASAPAAAPPPPVAAPPPPPTGASPPTPPAVGAASTDLTPELIQERLLAVVCERTGYPAEMLGLDADMEGDLGIDSIKRVEIAGTFTQDLPASERASIDIEQLTASRTLREVIAALESSLLGAATGAATQAVEDQRPFELRPADTERIGRFVVQSASAPAITATAGLADGGAVIIIGDETPLAEQLAEALAVHGYVLLLPRESAPRDEREAAELAAWVRDEHAGVKALVHIAPDDAEDGGLTSLFLLTQALHGDLAAAAEAGGAAILGVTRLGGAFAVAGQDVGGRAGHGAVAGFLKTLALEWPSVRVKAVDLPVEPGEDAVVQLVSELGAADGLVEVGYRRGERTHLTLAAGPLGDRPAEAPLSDDSVILLTGGARGITAEVASALAEQHRPTLLLVGRTALEDEPAEIGEMVDPADLRRTLIEARRRSGAELTPALVEADCRRILQGREVRRNLARMRAAGARVEYLPCDVQDQAAFAALIDDVYERHGRIDGVIHGAGVIEDRLVVDKRHASLMRVLETKAISARTLADKLRPDTVRFLVLFSSVSGRFGNRGQADYAAASEMLGKLAQDLDRHWQARVVSINWGPWRGAGMVSPALEQEFTRRGVALIPPEIGCRHLLDELSRGRKGEVEVVIGASTGLSDPRQGTAASGSAHAVIGGAEPMPLLAGGQIAAAPGGGIEFVREVSVAHDRYLDHHRVDGKPVFPFAGAMELMSECAVVASPGRRLAGLRQIRLLKGIVVPDQAGVAIKATATPRAQSGELEVMIGAPDGARPNYKALAFVSADGPGTVAAPAELPGLPAFPMSVEDAYRELLFHGPLFQGISAVRGMDERGSSATLHGSRPGVCVAGADTLSWLLDPVLIDSALQIQVVWARLYWEVTLLPAEIGGYTHLSDPHEGEPVRHELRIRPDSSQPMCHADHWFYGADGRLLATLGDVVGVGTQALNRLAAAQA